MRQITGTTASGPILVVEEPLSLWGGVDPGTGQIIDVHHPQRGESISGRILVMVSARGSSSSSSTLLECVRRGTAPAAIMLENMDSVLVAGAVVAAELYGREVLIAQIGSIAKFRRARCAKVSIDGAITLQPG